MKSVTAIYRRCPMKLTDNEKKVLFGFVCGAVIMIAGFFVIPPILKKLNNKISKHRKGLTEEDFEEMGPVIVKKNA